MSSNTTNNTYISEWQQVYNMTISQQSIDKIIQKNRQYADNLMSKNIIVACIVQKVQKNQMLIRPSNQNMIGKT
jgi:hypothetical protein